MSPTCHEQITTDRSVLPLEELYKMENIPENKYLINIFY